MISKSQSIKFQTDVDLREFIIVGETHLPVPNIIENVAVLLTLRWSFKLDGKRTRRLIFT